MLQKRIDTVEEDGDSSDREISVGDREYLSRIITKGMENKVADCRNSGGGSKDMVCLDTYRVLDSCRDKDCFEDVRVYLTAEGQ